MGDLGVPGGCHCACPLLGGHGWWMTPGLWGFPCIYGGHTVHVGVTLYVQVSHCTCAHVCERVCGTGPPKPALHPPFPHPLAMLLGLGAPGIPALFFAFFFLFFVCLNSTSSL